MVSIPVKMPLLIQFHHIIFNIPDTVTFAIIIVSGNSISIDNINLNFVSQDDSAQTYFFSTSSGGINGNPHNATNLTYFYINGNMHFTSYSGSAAVQTNVDLYTP